jgi:hypothetical protein
MYYPGQIVWSVEGQKPIKIDDGFSGKTRHFIDANNKTVCPKTIEEANTLLKRGRIVQAPLSSSWCWSCDYFLDKAPLEKCEAIDEHNRCNHCGGFNIYTAQFGRVCMACCYLLEKDALRLAAEELLKAINSDKKDNFYPTKVSLLIAKLVELDDPSKIKRNGDFREELDRVVRAGKKAVYESKKK